MLVRWSISDAILVDFGSQNEADFYQIFDWMVGVRALVAKSKNIEKPLEKQYFLQVRGLTVK